MKLRYVVGLVVLLTVGGVVAYTRSRPDLTVELIAPTTGTIRAYVDEQAVTELPHDYLVAMQIAGWLEPITLREGDPVRKDEVIARLDTADLQAEVRKIEFQIANLETRIRETRDNRLENNAMVQATAMVKSFDEAVRAAESRAKASGAVAEFARSEAERLRKVEQAEAASARELRAAETDARRAEAEHQSDLLQLAALRTMAAVSYIIPKAVSDYIAKKTYDRESYEQQLQEARVQLEVAKRNLERAEIRSPIDGVVLERHQTRRQYLTAGTQLLTLGRLEDLEVRAEILTERATHLSVGNPVEIYGEAIGPEPIAGKVVRIYPAGFTKISSLGVEQQRVNVSVQLDQRPEKLGVAFRVFVRIFYDEAEDALILPRTAIFRSESGAWQVMRVVDGRTQLQTVRLGITNDEQVQIVEGLSAGDTVVAKPSSEVVPGLRVAALGRE